MSENCSIPSAYYVSLYPNHLFFLSLIYILTNSFSLCFMCIRFIMQQFVFWSLEALIFA